jgi:prepilin-type processing-associated H-X9-DG protein
MAGSPILIARQGELMVHDGFTMAIGNAQDMRDLADHLDRKSNNIASIYSEHTGKPVSYWRDVMKAETWFGAQQAIDEGLADRFLDSGAGRQVTPPTDTWDMNIYRGQRRSADPPEPTADAKVQVPVMFADGHVEMWDWDAAAALAKCHSASDFKSVCAGEKSSGQPDNANHWALPHHSGPGAAPDKGGVVAALGRWNQTDGLTNKDGAHAHLMAHAKELGLPSGDGNADTTPPVSNTAWPEFTDEEVSGFLTALRGA